MVQYGFRLGSQTPPANRPADHRAHTPRGPGHAGEPLGSNKGHEPLLDPLYFQMALDPGITPPVGLSGAAMPPAALPLREDLQNLLSGLARRVAWGGDRRRGSARIELAEGALAGATLVVHTEQRSVSVEIELPGGAVGANGLEQRLLERLEARGFAARVRIE